MRLHHAQAKLVGVVAFLDVGQLAGRLGGEVHAVRAVHFAGHQLDTFLKRHIPRVQRLELGLVVAGVHDGIGQFQRAFAAVFPVRGQGHARPGRFAQLTDFGDFRLGVGHKSVDAHHGRHAGTLHRIDVVQQVAAACLHEAHVLGTVFLRQRTPRHGHGRAAVALERADGRHDHGGVRGEAAVVALEVPEFLIPDVRAETGLRNMVFIQLEADPVRDDRTLPDGDVGERPGVYEHGLAFDGLDKVRIDGFHHPRGHSAVHFEIGGGHGFAVAVVGHDDLAHALPEVLQILGDGENGHDFGRHGDVKAGTHHEPVGAPVGAVHADDDVAQGLAAEIHDPAHVHIGGVDVQAGHPRQLEQLFIIIIPLMLHTGSQRHHGEVMGVHHRVDIAGKTQGILRQRDALGKPAARGRALHAHRGAARRLADGGGSALVAASEALYEADGGRGFALAEGRGRNGGHVDILAVGLVPEALKHGPVVDLAHHMAVRQELFIKEAHITTKLLHGFHTGFGILSDFPVSVFFRIEHHECLLFLLIRKSKKVCRHRQD